MQRIDKGADPHRARYHSSVMDIENLDAGQEFDELPDTYTIFITENDLYKEGFGIYPIERINGATGKPFQDGSYNLKENPKGVAEELIARATQESVDLVRKWIGLVTA